MTSQLQFSPTKSSAQQSIQKYHKKKVKILVQTYEKNIYRIDETWMGSAPISALNATEGEFPVPM